MTYSGVGNKSQSCGELLTNVDHNKKALGFVDGDQFEKELET